MTPAQVEEIVKRATKEAVTETLATLGFNVEDPAALRADMDHLRRWRGIVELLARQGAMATVTVLVGAAIATFWFGVKAALTKTGMG